MGRSEVLGMFPPLLSSRSADKGYISRYRDKYCGKGDLREEGFIPDHRSWTQSLVAVWSKMHDLEAARQTHL